MFYWLDPLVNYEIYDDGKKYVQLAANPQFLEGCLEKLEVMGNFVGFRGVKDNTIID